MHLYQTRHTFTRIVSKEIGPVTEPPDALDHKSLQTMRVYIQLPFAHVATPVRRHARSASAERAGRGRGTRPRVNCWDAT